MTAIEVPAAVPQSTAGRLAHLALPLGAFITTFVIFAPFARIGVDIQHDGMVLKSALDVLSGKVIHRDSFIYNSSLTPFVHATFLYIFGPTLLTLKFANVFMYALAASILVSIWRQFLSPGLTIAAFVLWLICAPFYHPDQPPWHITPSVAPPAPLLGNIMLPWSSVCALPFQAGTLACLLAVLRKSNTGWNALSAGCGAALVFYCRILTGVTLFAAVLLTLILVPVLNREKINRRALLMVCLGSLAVHALFIGYFCLHGALYEWYYQILVWPREWAASWPIGWFETVLLHATLAGVVVPMTALALAPAYLFPQRQTADTGERLSWRARFMPWGLLLIPYYILLGYYIHSQWWRFCNLRQTGWASATPVCLALLLLFTCRTAIIRRACSALDSAVIAMCILAGASLIQFYPSPDERHLYWALAPAFGPFVYAMLRAARSRAVFAYLALAVLFLPLLHNRLIIANMKLSQTYVALDNPPALRKMLVPESYAVSFQIMSNIFAAHPEKPILIEGPDALWAVFTDNLENPGPFFVSLDFSSALLKQSTEKNSVCSRQEEVTARHIAFIKEKLPFVVLQRSVPKIQQLLGELGYTNQYGIAIPPEASSPQN